MNRDITEGIGMLAKRLRSLILDKYRFSSTQFLSFYASLMFVNTFFFSYFGLKGTEVFSFAVSDGWCPSTKGVIGNHCFGDFFYLYKTANLPNPYSSEFFIQYPPFSLFIIKPFIGITRAAGETISILLYFLICVPILLITFNKLIKMFSVSESVNTEPRIRKVLLLTSFISVPMLVSFDRGNTILLTLPFVILYLNSMLIGSNRDSVIWSSIATVLKPQLMIFALMKIHTPKKMVSQLCINALALLATFPLYPENFATMFRDWSINTIKHNQYAGVSSIYPVNLSLISTINLVRSLVHFVFYREIKLYLPNSQLVALVSIFLFACTVKIILKNKGNNYINYLSIVCCLILIGGTTFHYYLVLLIPAYVMYQIHMDKVFPSQTPLKKSIVAIQILIYTLTLLPIAVPASLIANVVGIKVSLSVSLHFLAISPLMLLLLILLLFERRDRSEECLKKL